MRRYAATLEAVRLSGASMTMLNGNDRFVAEGAIMGAEGALIGIANLMPEGWAEILRLAGEQRINEALDLQRRMRALQELIFREPILDAVARMKVVLADMGVIEHADVRRPQLGVSAEERKAVLDGYRRVQETIGALAQS
jgi:dihydrodipicolinate synthase/N-acetylneuraminate lyase